MFATALCFHIVGKPAAASRPRVTIKGTFYSKPYADWRKDALEQLAPQAARLNTPISYPVNVAVDVSAARPKATILGAPLPDVDNYAKAALDALTKAGVWVDDTLVRCLTVRKRWADDGETPGFSIFINGAECA